MLDVHTHILPEIDDGSRNIKESIAMLRRESADGVNAVVLSPHFYADNEGPEEFIKRRDEAFERLNDSILHISDNTKLPMLIKGAEVRFYDGMGDTEGVEQFCIGNTNYILIEMPNRLWSKSVLEDLMKLRRRNLRPIIAHINRYHAFYDTNMIQNLIENGMLIQINTEAFHGFFSRRRAVELMNNKLIQFVGSDCHGMNHRVPDMGSAMDVIRRKCEDYSERYLLRKAGLITGIRQNDEEQIVEESN